ncbi:sensor histidine kinase [Paenibacillus sp. N4]|uniref:sensor histidine kinase n=1 Tax=Paenibacillus vietnamensis TaxID=2590547 RepID=UPI001CD0A3C1|nr:sensor histidine kinase [Paenibacillus vietnamensis]MCA0753436.1 sensor histidine kinase [Paenibacillus vietnamensis]
MRIGTKMIIGYLFLVVLPFLAFALFIYYQLHERLMTQYQLTNQQNMEQQVANLEEGMAKIESLYSIYQNNTALIEFLRGDYADDRELIYSFLKEISPAFSFAALGEPMVKQIIAYTKTEKRLLAVPEFGDYSELNGVLSTEEMAKLRPAKGLWKKSFDSASGPSLTYYHKLYSDTYSSELGILQMMVKPAIIEEFIQALSAMHPNNTILMIDSEGAIVYKVRDRLLSSGQLVDIQSTVMQGKEKLFRADHGNLLVNSVQAPRLDLTIVEVNRQDILFQSMWTKLWWAGAGASLLIVLSVFYYVLLSSLTKRILLLSRHMRRVGQDFLGNPYAGKPGKDEIGFLISNYNAMIGRIDELVNRVQKVELLKKEADFKMLQAQIQPHFLYNTLETMRMLARSNRDHKVAEMAFSLGNLLRYSLSKNNDTTLMEEVEHIRSYIAIHQIRMQDLRFAFESDDRLLTIRCPRFILQPLVENALLHGVSGKKGGKEIVVRLKQGKGCAVIEVWDNGKGLEQDHLLLLRRMIDGEAAAALTHKGTGIGLNNVTERVKAYFGQESGMSIESKAGEWTKCSLKLMLEENGHAQTDDCR